MRDVDSFKYIVKRQARKKTKTKTDVYGAIPLCYVLYRGARFPIMQKRKLRLRDVGNLLKSVG